MSNVFIGGPWDDQEGLDIHGNHVREAPKRPTSFIDEMRAQAVKDGFQRDLKRDPDLPNEAERRQGEAYLHDLVNQIDAAAAASGRLVIEDWQDSEFTHPKPGLAGSERADLLRRGQAALDRMTKDDHRELRREIRDTQRQQVAQHQRQQFGAEVADAAWRVFQEVAPDLRDVSEDVIADYARRIYRDGMFSAEDFANSDGSMNAHAVVELALGTAEELRKAGYSRPVAARDDTASVMTRLRTESGF